MAFAALARSHYENFPARSALVPRAAREDLAAIYAFCRTTDDLGDEIPGDRAAALDSWEADLRRAVDRGGAGGGPDLPVLAALAITVARCGIELDLLLRLIEANRRDQIARRHADMDALLDYCGLSAIPVGRMVLAVIAAHGGISADPPACGRDRPALVPDELAALADATTIGLQLANFWQDLARDWAQDRCYLPLDACARHRIDPEAELGLPAASAGLRRLVREMTGEARTWLARGWPLADRLRPRWRPLVRGFTRGGWAICDAIERQGHDTLRARPVLSSVRRTAIVAREILAAVRTAPPLDHEPIGT